MASENRPLTFYTASILQRYIDLLIKNTDYNIIQLRTTKSLQKDGSVVFDVPDFEDEVLVRKIQVLFADVQVIAKYRKKLVNLKWVHTAANGIDKLMDSFKNDEPFPNFKLTKSPGSLHAPHIAEYVVGYMIAKERSFFKTMDLQQNSKWDQLAFSNRRCLSSLTIGILGVGYIGKHLSKICKEFGMTVWGLARRQRSAENICPHVDVFVTQERLDDLLKNCDYVCNVLPSTAQTRDMLSGDVFKSCSEKKSVFINIGRGDVIDEQSIVTAINEGWLSGAILDTFCKEPLPESSPLWSLPGVIVTPNVSGWSTHASHTENVVEFLLDNLQRFVDGRPLKNVLDWSQGY